MGTMRHIEQVARKTPRIEFLICDPEVGNHSVTTVLVAHELLPIVGGMRADDKVDAVLS